MPTKLKNLVITKVALVDEGSCSAAHIKLYKRKEGGNETMNFEEILKSLSEDQRKVIEAEVDKAKQTLPEGAMSAEDAAKLEETKSAMEQSKKAAEDELAKLKKEVPAGASDEDLLKNVDPAVKALIEKARSQAAAAETAIKKMKDEADTRGALIKAKELPNIGAKEEELAKAFKDLKNLDPKLYDSMFGILKAANNMIADGNTTQQIGKSAYGAEKVSKASDAAWAEIEKVAEDIKKSAKCTQEQAIAKAISENADLYQKYLDNIE